MQLCREIARFQLIPQNVCMKSFVYHVKIDYIGMNAAIIQIVVAFTDISGTINHIDAAYLVDICFDTLGRNAYITRQLASMTNYLKMVVVF